jgi:predicted nucleic acid-binding protein
MKAYCDSSVMVAWFHPTDDFAGPVTDWIRENDVDFIWNAVLRAETRHNLRKLKMPYARTSWNAFRAAEQTQKLVARKNQVDALLDDLDDLSARLAQAVDAGTWDFFHVAAAVRTNCDCFATCDQAQAEVAKRAGLKVKLFKIRSPRRRRIARRLTAMPGFQ